jgi:hypothetical protein
MKRKNVIGLLIFAAALCLCVYGVLKGQADEVMVKATKICLECIGLG